MTLPVTLKPTQVYLARKLLLDMERRQSLDLVEEGIEADPHGGLSRRDGAHGTTIDSSEFGLIVSFRIVDDRAVELIDFVDLLD